MVNLTRIYTRTGDAGQTRLGDMSETSKTDLRLEAYACVDEGNAHIGVALAQGGFADDVVALLTRVQNDLFDVGADFSTPIVSDPKYPPLRVTQPYVDPEHEPVLGHLRQGLADHLAQFVEEGMQGDDPLCRAVAVIDAAGFARI